MLILQHKSFSTFYNVFFNASRKNGKDMQTF
jgi:hypothetical protein